MNDHDTSSPRLGRLLHGAFERYHTLVVTKVQDAGFRDVTPAQAQLIAHIGQDPIKAVDLAARVGVSKQALSLMAAELATKGYLAHQDDPRDGRAKLLVMSAKGRALKRAGDAARQAAEDELLAALTPEDKAALPRILNQVSSGKA